MCVCARRCVEQDVCARTCDNACVHVDVQDVCARRRAYITSKVAPPRCVHIDVSAHRYAYITSIVAGLQCTHIYASTCVYDVSAHRYAYITLTSMQVHVYISHLCALTSMQVHVYMYASNVCK